MIHNSVLKTGAQIESATAASIMTTLSMIRAEEPEIFQALVRQCVNPTRRSWPVEAEFLRQRHLVGTNGQPYPAVVKVVRAAVDQDDPALRINPALG